MVGEKGQKDMNGYSDRRDAQVFLLGNFNYFKLISVIQFIEPGVFVAIPSFKLLVVPEFYAIKMESQQVVEHPTIPLNILKNKIT